MHPTPRTRRRPLRTAAALTAAAAALALTACTPAPGPDRAAEDCITPDALGIIVAVHANATPGIPTEAGCLIGKALDNRAPISIVAEDGKPYPAQAKHTYNVTPGSDTYAGDLKTAKAALIKTVSATAARTDGDDTLAALNLAANLANGAKNPALIIISPGLPDTGDVAMTVESMRTATPAAVVAEAQKRGSIPALPGVQILWIGNGTAAGTQQPLHPSQARNYQAIWEALLTKAGARTTFINGPASGTGTPNNNGHTIHPVTPDTKGPIDIPDTGTTIPYPNTSALGFHPNSTTLRDPAAAATELTPVIAWLKANPHRTTLITGTTTSAGTHDSLRELSEARAQAVKDLLAAAGIDPQRIRIEGKGKDFEGFIEDQNPDGSLDEAKGELNRKVILALTP
jgi:outer membrane protein OmpA-like peptidoglycan-associated protein